jgi:hypothetical protein
MTIAFGKIIIEMAARRCSSFAQSNFSAKERSFAQSFLNGLAGRKSAPSQQNSRIVKQKNSNSYTTKIEFLLVLDTEA